jgi:hypothetical protein
MGNTHSDDDFSAFDGHEKMFFGLIEPYAYIRAEVEAGLRAQISDSELHAIKTVAEPKFLTLGHKLDDGAVLITQFGFCVLCKLDVIWAEGAQREVIDATLTFLFGDIDRTDDERRSRKFVDVHADAHTSFEWEVFRLRFLAFRDESAGRVSPTLLS